MAAIDGASPTGAGKPVFSDSYRSTVLGLLVVAYTFNFIDRTIIATIGQAIKVDLKITDTQLGLLGGIYFALLYTLLGIPIARLAERFNRVNIISAAILIWSAFTALCGTATSFAQLAAYRFGVGFGEAGLSPPAHSLISDYYEPKKRASALAVYSFGIPLGTMFGAVAGGWLAQNFSWRIAFMLVGLPGVLIAIAMKLVVKEPPRGHSEPAQPVAEQVLDAPAQVPAKPPFTWSGEFNELGSVIKILFGKWPVLHMVLGVTIASFGSYGSGQFVPPYFTRTFGLDYAQVGLITGLVGGFSAGIGTLVGGFLTDRLAKRSARWYSLTPAIGLTIATPIYIAAYMAPSWQTAAMILLVPGIFHYTYLGPTFGVVQNMVDTRRRATATALLFFFLNLIALGGGPVFTGFIIDKFAAFHFAMPQATGIFTSVASLFGSHIDFQAVCPGGTAPPGAAQAVADSCKTSLVTATREGVVVSIWFYLWAAFHYLLGSFGLAKTLAKARADRGEAD